jgi:parallel beta-helix repeat protein
MRFALFAMSIIFLLLIPNGYAWQYRMPVAIDNSHNFNNLTNYQVLVTLDTQSLISQGKMQSDCDDIRFKDSDDITNLNYWLESGCNTANTVIWVKVPSIPRYSIKTIYLYYGNSSAVSESNGSATFDYFDLGDIYSTWTQGTYACSQEVDGNPGPSYRCPSAVGYYMYKNISLVPGRIITFNVKSNGLGNFYFLTDSTGKGQMYRLDTRAQGGLCWWGTCPSGFATTSSWTSWDAPSSGFSAAPNSWYKLTIVINSTTSAVLYYNQTTDYSPRTETFGNLLGTYNFYYYSNYIGLVGDGLGSSYSTWWDNIIVRKHTHPEPITSLGNEARVCDSCTSCTNALNDVQREVYLTSDIGNSGSTCIYDPVGFNNKIFDCQGHTIDGVGSNYAIYLIGKSNNTIRNCTISEFAFGIYLVSSSNITITRNRLNNNIAYGIRFERTNLTEISNNIILGGTRSISFDNVSFNSTIYNNIFTKAVEDPGLSTYIYNASYSPMYFNGVNYSDMLLFTYLGQPSPDIITADNQPVTSADGTGNFELLLLNRTPDGTPANITLFVRDLTPFLISLGLPANCNTIDTLIGTPCCHYYKNSSFVAQGFGSNYLWNDTFNETYHVVDGLTSPPYLIVGTVLPGTGNHSYCHNGIGNFWEESLTPVPGDCGKVIVSSPTAGNYSGNITIAWSAQDSPLPVTYDVYARNIDTGSLQFITSTTGLTYEWLPRQTGNFKIEIIPWVSGSRINGTHSLSEQFSCERAIGPPSVQVSLKLDTCTIPDLRVYVPGVGDMEAGSLTNQIWYNPPHFWIAAYSPALGLVWALIHSQVQPVYIATEV